MLFQVFKSATLVLGLLNLAARNVLANDEFFTVNYNVRCVSTCISREVTNADLYPSSTHTLLIRLLRPLKLARYARQLRIHPASRLAALSKHFIPLIV